MSDSARSSTTPQPIAPQDGGSGDAQLEEVAAIPSAENQPTVISSRPAAASSSQRSTAVESQSPPRPPEGVRSGTRLGDVELLDHIGGGGMGQVYRGVDRRLSRPVAVKVMSRHQASDSDAVRRFLNEARSAARLNHRNIAQVFSAGDSDGCPYIVFEFVEGANIRSIVEKRGPLPLEEALSYTLQIADALAHAAEMRIVHRDVKPSNILIDSKGQAKLIDLGLARLTEPSPPEGDLTASGVTLGTFDYISPEQARDPRNADVRSDIYSLGCTFFYMLVGRPPFPEGTVLQKLLQHQGDEPPDVCQFRPDLPDEAAQVLARMMAKDPRRRYPDSGHLLEGLLGLADLIGLHPTGPAHTVWLPPQESHISTLQRQLPWLAPATILACLVMMLHFLWSNQDEAADLAMQSLPSPTVQAVSAAPERLSPGAGGQGPAKVTPGEVNGSAGVSPAADAPVASGTSGGPPPASLPADTAVGAVEPASATGAADNGAVKSTFQGLLKEEFPPSSLGPEPLAARLSSPTELAAAMTVAGPTSGEGALNAATKPPAAEAVPASPAAAPVAPTDSVVVAPGSQDPTHFASVSAALAGKPGASVIELRYSGRQVEKPVTLPNRTLTLRAGAGCQPVVAFQPSAADPVLCPRDMIRVGGGAISLEGIALELDVPRNMPSEAWSLVRFSAQSVLRLRDCSVTIRNSADDLKTYHQNVAFFRMVAAETLPVGLPAAKAAPPATLDLKNCIVRGEAALVRISGEMPLALNWDNGLLATTEPVLLAGGSGRIPPAGSTIHMGWTHVTIATGQELMRLAVDEYRPHLAPIAVSESACVVSCPAKPLVHISGSPDPLPLLAKLRWDGRESLAEASPTRVVVDPTGISSEDELIQVEALVAQETESVGLPAVEGRIPWLQSPLPARAVHAAQPAEFELSTADPAVLGVNRDTSALPGFVAAQLPALPPEPAATSSDTAVERLADPLVGQSPTIRW